MIVRLCEKKDLEQVIHIYDLIHEQEEKGKMTIGWIRQIYPTKYTAILFSKRIICLEDNNTIVARARINQKQDPSYRKAHWIYTTKNETYARKHNCFYLRMDTNEINQVV